MSDGAIEFDDESVVVEQLVKWRATFRRHIRDQEKRRDTIA